MVEWVATDTRGSEADCVAQCLAGGTATGLGGARESPADRIGAGGTPSQCAAGSALRREKLGAPHGKTSRDGIHVTATWAAERLMRKDSRPLFCSSARQPSEPRALGKALTQHAIRALIRSRRLRRRGMDTIDPPLGLLGKEPMLPPFKPVDVGGLSASDPLRQSTTVRCGGVQSSELSRAYLNRPY